MTNTNSKPASAAKYYETATIKKLPKSRLEITGSIASADWEKFRKEALKNIGESVKIDGFRQGQIPENILVAKVGQSVINEEMAELALSKAYVQILIDNKIDAIGKPEVQITKIASGNPLEFKATTAIIPELTLPDVKSLAAAEVKKSSPKELKVEDKDVEEAILKIRKSRVTHEGHDHAKMSPEEHEKAIMDSLPEFNDEFVRGLGDFKDMNDFKNKVREMVGQNKKDEAQEKLRLHIADALTDAVKLELPDIMVETELNRTQAQFETDIEKMGVKLEDYLKHAKKTLEEIREDWRPHAEKKAKLQMILNSIATKENIHPDQKEIEAEVSHIVEHYKDADRERATVYAETVLTNENVFLWLESSK
ncbi:MAG: trigger factor [Candidatus Paceibacterota bacterium]